MWTPTEEVAAAIRFGLTGDVRARLRQVRYVLDGLDAAAEQLRASLERYENDEAG